MLEIFRNKISRPVVAVPNQDQWSLAKANDPNVLRFARKTKEGEVEFEVEIDLVGRRVVKKHPGGTVYVFEDFPKLPSTSLNIYDLSEMKKAKVGATLGIHPLEERFISSTKSRRKDPSTPHKRQLAQSYRTQVIWTDGRLS